MDGQGTDDRRMHEGDKPGLVEGRGREERDEEPVAEADRIGADDEDGDSRRGAERDIAESIPDQAHERAE